MRADWATIFLVEGDQIRRHSNGTRGPNALRGPGTSLRPLGDSSALAKILRERVVLRFDDQSTVTDPEFEISAAAAREVGFTSAAYAPLPADGPPLGIAVFKRRVDPFTDEDVELLQAFAVQAGNAVTNAQLVSDMEHRNTDLAEALELKTATSNVLALISAHPGDLASVLDGVLHLVMKLSDADAANYSAMSGTSGTIVAAVGHQAQVALGFTYTLDFPNLRVRIDDYQSQVGPHPTFGPFGLRTGIRSQLSVSVIDDGVHVGQIAVSRRDLRPFTDDSFVAVQAFADLAVIAISNAKLFNDLDAALARQSAMTDVLDAVSTADSISSPCSTGLPGKPTA